MLLRQPQHIRIHLRHHAANLQAIANPRHPRIAMLFILHNVDGKNRVPQPLQAVLAIEPVPAVIHRRDVQESAARSALCGGLPFCGLIGSSIVIWVPVVQCSSATPAAA